MNLIEIGGEWRTTLNSRGLPIAPTREGIIAFYAWFKRSYAQDAKRRPLVVFHGTRADIEVFDPNASVSHPWLLGSDQKLGFFFTDNPGTKSDSGPWHGAAGYASTRQVDGETYAADGANVVAAYLALDCPYLMTAAQYRQCATRPDLKEELEALGYDGVIVDDGTFIAFYPWQVKSAIGNIGHFSREDARITDRFVKITSDPQHNKAQCDSLNGTLSITHTEMTPHDTTGMIFDATSPLAQRVCIRP